MCNKRQPLLKQCFDGVDWFNVHISLIYGLGWLILYVFRLPSAINWQVRVFQLIKANYIMLVAKFTISGLIYIGTDVCLIISSVSITRIKSFNNRRALEASNKRIEFVLKRSKIGTKTSSWKSLALRTFSYLINNYRIYMDYRPRLN